MSSIESLAVRLESDRYSRRTLSDGTGIVIDVEALQVMSLNRSGMFLLDAIADGTTDADRLRERLTERYEVDDATAARDIGELLDAIDRSLTRSRAG